MSWSVLISFRYCAFSPQAQELSEANVKIGLLEKKVESIDSEITRRISAEKEETDKIRKAMENQER